MNVYKEIYELKNYQKIGDDKKVKEIIEQIKEESFSLLPNYNKKIKNVFITNSQFLSSSIEMVNKYIIDEIDSQNLLNDIKPKSPISFDKDKSILYINGKNILITRKTVEPIDHYILEYIFFYETSLEAKTYFEDISITILHDDYDNKTSFNKFRHACDRLNKKISEGTNHEINDFIKYKTGNSGWCQINKKYL